MDPIRSFIDQNKERFLEELIDFLKIPSISADSRYKEDVSKAANWLATKMEALELDKVEIFPTPGHPIVYGEKITDKNLPTILVYGHYDVQPPDPLELWESPPFEPVIKDEKIYARGACDDKGQLYMHVKAMEILIAQGELPCNVKFIIEGEEEVGSSNLEDFIRKHKEMLQTDIIAISDTSMIANDTPSITVGLRGMAYMEVFLTGPNRDLHSGVYGGAVGNPINMLCEMIAKLKDENGVIQIPGFYDKVEKISEADRKEMAKRPFSYEAYCESIGISATFGESGYTPIEQASIRPTLDVNGIWGGYIGEGAKTVLPSKAFAKISMRLVPNQEPDEIAALFKNFIEEIAPPSVSVEVVAHHGGKPAVVSTQSKAYRAAAKAYEDTFGTAPIPTRDGGSIPIVAMFQEVLGADTVLMGFGLDSDAIHSPNEHFGIFNFLKGIETIPRFHNYFKEFSKNS